jgi:photosystem II stability/assembly factor-like uncharacterized protein
MNNNFNPIFYITLLSTKKHQLGSKNPETGLFYGNGFDNMWSHLGWTNGRTNSVTIDEKSGGKIIYAACGNGVMKSVDYGRTWKIITDHLNTEILKVGIDPGNSNTIYATGAYGVFKSLDGGKTWKEKNKGRKTPYCAHILFDKKRILLASEEGIYVSTNKGESWSILALEGKGIRILTQSESNPELLAVGTEEDGVFISEDGGKTFIQKNAGLLHKTIYSIEFDPNNPDVLYCGGFESGLYKTVDKGTNWQKCGEVFSGMNIHAVKVFPKDSNIVFVGTYNNGLYKSINAGEDWEDISSFEFEKGQIGEICIFKEKLLEAKPKNEILNKKCKQYKYDPDFAKRRVDTLKYISHYSEMLGIYAPLSKIILGKEIDKAYKEIDYLIDSERIGGMFLLHQLTTAYFYGKKYLPARLIAKIRDAFKNKTFYRGDTENHLLLYYSAVYLLSQEFPNLPGSEWYNGRSSKENFKEAESHILSWMDITTTIGQGEFDSPTYHTVFLVALMSLFDHAKDKKMKKKAQLMLDYLYADFAVEHLKGYYCGGHSRDYPDPPNITDPRTSPMQAWAYLLFGKTEFPEEARDFGLLFYPIVTSYEIPEIIYKIATDRETPYFHTKTKRVRNIFRFEDIKNPPVYKCTYMDKNFALGSLMGGGVLQPIQQHTWDVTFINNKPHNTIFSLHPYSDPTELGMFFPEEIKFMVEEVHKYHKIYKSPDKWASGSPYEKTFQYNNSIIVLYNIKPGILYEEVDAHFPKDLEEKIEHPSGWIFCNAGDTYIAYYPFKPYEWVDEGHSLRLRSKYIKNGTILEAAAAEKYNNSFESFIQQITSNKIDINSFDDTLTATYVNSDGDELKFMFDGDRILNGKKVDFKDYKLFKGPFLNAEVGSKKLEIKYKNIIRNLDLKKVLIEEKKTK